MIDAISHKQRIVLNHGNTPDFLMLSGGAIRSGKTYATMLAFVLWSIEHFPGRRFILAGQSVEAVRRNYADDMHVMMHDLGFHPRMILSHGTRIVLPVGDRFSTYHLVGANDERSALRLQGMTAAGALLDEVVLLPQSFFNQVMARLSFAGSKAWGTFNPASPGHWFKRQVVDKLDEQKGRLLEFVLDDNPTLSAEVKARYKAQFSGHYYQRLIEGMWAAPSGLIFPEYSIVRHNQALRRLAVSIDWGVSNVFAALMFGSAQDGTVCADELYHDARLDGTLSEDLTLQKLVQWIGGRTVRVVYVDPSMPVTFKRKLREAGMTVRNADNDVEAGLMTTANRLARKDIVIHQRCTHLLAEMQGYVWDERKAELGEDAPVKQADHAADALRYYAHTTGKLGYLPAAIPKPAGM